MINLNVLKEIEGEITRLKCDTDTYPLTGLTVEFIEPEKHDLEEDYGYGELVRIYNNKHSYVCVANDALFYLSGLEKAIPGIEPNNPNHVGYSANENIWRAIAKADVYE